MKRLLSISVILLLCCTDHNSNTKNQLLFFPKDISELESLGFRRLRIFKEDPYPVYLTKTINDTIVSFSFYDDKKYIKYLNFLDDSVDITGVKKMIRSYDKSFNDSSKTVSVSSGGKYLQYDVFTGARGYELAYYSDLSLKKKEDPSALRVTDDPITKH